MLGLNTYRMTERPRLVRALAVAACLAAAGMLASARPARADNDIVYVSSTKNASIKVAKGKPKTIMTSAAFYQIVIGDPEIANVNPLTDNSFYVLGNNLGTTGIALFDENKQLVGTVDIEVTLDTDQLASTIRDSVPDANIKVGSANGRVVLSGEADDAVAAEKANKIATRLFRQRGGHQLGQHLVLAAGPAQCPLRRDQPPGRPGTRRQDTAPISPTASAGAIVTSTPGTIVDGRDRRDHRLGCCRTALRSTSPSRRWKIAALARRLAEPNLIARSGEKASFLAGGEFPIPVSEDNGKITVTYKKYGVSLDFTPTVLKDGLVSLDIAPEVSSIDASASLQYRQHLGAGLHRAPRQDIGRPEERPELHDRRPAAVAERHHHLAHSRPRQDAGAWIAVFLQVLSAARDRSGHHRHALSGQAGRSVEEAASRPTARSRPAMPTISSAIPRK